jgi:hypothetical protein
MNDAQASTPPNRLIAPMATHRNAISSGCIFNLHNIVMGLNVGIPGLNGHVA